MKRIFMLMAPLALMLAAAMALSGVAQAAGSPTARCKQEAANLGIVGSYNFVGGNNKRADNFSSKATAGADVFCGFGGNDSIGTLDAGDFFIGGDGLDTVTTNNGTFYGGAGNDSVVNNYSKGTFNGSDGDDSVTTNNGTFNGEAGNDNITFNEDPGIFNGGSGNDSVGLNFVFGIFNGSDGLDTVNENRGGTLDSVEVVLTP